MAAIGGYRRPAKQVDGKNRGRIKTLPFTIQPFTSLTVKGFSGKLALCGFRASTGLLVPDGQAVNEPEETSMFPGAALRNLKPEVQQGQVTLSTCYGGADPGHREAGLCLRPRSRWKGGQPR